MSREYVERVCPVCRAHFSAAFTQVKIGRGVYCSKPCASKARHGNRTPAERFWAKVDRRGPDECWLWRAGRHKAGYGIFVHEKRAQTASRVAYELTYGAIPAGQFVCHRCDNPPCCNPSHLFAAPHAENVADMWRKGRSVTQTRPQGQARGSRVGLAKLREQDVAEARRRYTGKRGEIAALAREFGVSDTAMGYALRGHTWSHVNSHLTPTE